MTLLEAYKTLDNAQTHLIVSRSDGPFFDGTDEEYKAYTDACELLGEGKKELNRQAAKQ